jgi:16S rRNA (uracil1498-N3)-methyltransferase
VARDLSPRRLERLRTVAREAAEQSERGLVPLVEGPAPLSTELAEGRVLLAERLGGSRLAAIEPPTVLIVGPEGGFTPAELAEASDAGVALAWLGPRILRAETVAVAAASVVLSRTRDFA